MKSLVFCTSFIKDDHAWKGRYQRWLDFYKNIPIDADKRIMIDDGSPYLPSSDVIQSITSNDNPSQYDNENLLIRFDENLGRQGLLAYPGWWRSFLHSIVIAEQLNADKIIHIESDAYILSQRLVDFINDIKSGWHVLWTQRYGFPETGIQIICHDQFENFEKFKEDFSKNDFSDFAENLLPFTSVNRNFKGDRYSELKRNRSIFRSRKFDWFPLFQLDFFRQPIPCDADFATQCIDRQPIQFRPHE